MLVMKIRRKLSISHHRLGSSVETVGRFHPGARGIVAAVAACMGGRLGPTRPRRIIGCAVAVVMTTGILLLTCSDALAQQENVPPIAAAPRLRLGGSAGVGVGSFGAAAAASGRVGVQITQFLAASYQITRTGSREFLGGNSDAWTSHGLLIEYMKPGKMFAIGAGPSFASGTVKHGCFTVMTECNPPSTSESYNRLGFDGRVAYTFGANRPAWRGGFTLELGLHASPHSGVFTFGIGFDIF
jgi:hypothetical protein